MRNRTMKAFRATLMGRRAALSPGPALQDTWQQIWRRAMAYNTKPVAQKSLPSSLSWVTAFALPRAVAQRSPKLPLRSRLQSQLLLLRRKFHSSGARMSAGGRSARESAEESLSLTARMKRLSREYGWATIGVYAAFSVLDFPFCFLLVRLVGTDKIAEAEHWVLSNVSQFIPQRIKDVWHYWRHPAAAEAEAEEAVATRDQAAGADNKHLDGPDARGPGRDGWGVKEAQERVKAEASLATQLALAYAIHKSFIFIRVPLTAAITPRVVKILRGWGWQIGKRRPKA